MSGPKETQAHAKRLIELVLQFPVNDERSKHLLAATVTGKSADAQLYGQDAYEREVTGELKELVEWVEYEEMLRNQIFEMEAMAAYSSVKDSGPNIDAPPGLEESAEAGDPDAQAEIAALWHQQAVDTQREIDELQEDVFRLQSTRLLQEFVSKRVRAGAQLARAVHASGNDAAPGDDELQRLASERDELVRELAELTGELEAAQARAQEDTRTCRQLMRDNRETWAEIMRRKRERLGEEAAGGGAAVGGKLAELRTRRKAAQDEYERVLTVLQRMIVASGIDWSENDSLRELLMSSAD